MAGNGGLGGGGGAGIDGARGGESGGENPSPSTTVWRMENASASHRACVEATYTESQNAACMPLKRLSMAAALSAAGGDGGSIGGGGDGGSGGGLRGGGCGGGLGAISRARWSSVKSSRCAESSSNGCEEHVPSSKPAYGPLYACLVQS